MKKTITVIFALIMCVSFSSCGVILTNILSEETTEYFGFDKSHFTVVEEEDTHGGFHGDGSYYLILDCSSDPETAKSIISDWREIPLSENLNIVMYGGEKDGISYGYDFAEKAHWPDIENGVYKFVDRNSESRDETDDSELLDRYSFNFSIALYDLDSNKLYYFEYDS